MCIRDRCGAGDVVVTQDYGVAAMALGRGARCLNQNGLLYTNGNIEQLLYTRHENGKARRRGHYTPVPKRTLADDEAFRRALSAMPVSYTHLDQFGLSGGDAAHPRALSTAHRPCAAAGRALSLIHI